MRRLRCLLGWHRVYFFYTDGMVFSWCEHCAWRKADPRSVKPGMFQ